MTDDNDIPGVFEWPKTDASRARERTPADIPDDEVAYPGPSGIRCWFCREPAATIGYGFAVCGGRQLGEVSCAERAGHLFRRSIQEVTDG